MSDIVFLLVLSAGVSSGGSPGAWCAVSLRNAPGGANAGIAIWGAGRSMGHFRVAHPSQRVVALPMAAPD